MNGEKNPTFNRPKREKELATSLERVTKNDNIAFTSIENPFGEGAIS
jgi:hypothetical protein